MRNSRTFSATRGGTTFEELTTQLGPALQRPMVGRGTPYADFDNDGDVGPLLTSNNGSPQLLRNDNGNQNNVLRLKTIGTRSNHDGIGATVTRKSDKGARLFQMVKTGSSYLSQSEMPLTFGLGKQEGAVNIEIAWPSRREDSIAEIKPNQFITVKEGKGIVSSYPIVFGKPAP